VFNKICKELAKFNSMENKMISAIEMTQDAYDDLIENDLHCFKTRGDGRAVIVYLLIESGLIQINNESLKDVFIVAKEVT